MQTGKRSGDPADNILIVDDEAPNLRLLGDILSGAGYRVRPARVARLAMDAARAQPPDLILLDVRMPEMDGFELCRHLKEDDRTRDIPIIFVSALQEVDDRVRGFEVGGVDFVSKPFQELEILARVRNHLALRKITVRLEDLVAHRTAELAAKNRALNAEIEERTRAEAALRGSQRFTARLIETANVMIVGLDTQGRVTLANPATKQTTGYAPSELVGRDWIECLVPKRLVPEVRGELTRLVSGDPPRQFENALLTRSGEERIVAWSNSTVEKDGQIVGTLSFGVDVTERREQEQRLEAYRNRLKALASELTVNEERERRRLADELHDGPIQALAYVGMQLASARQQADYSAREQALDAVSESLRQATLTANRIVTDLSSPVLKELGLTMAISGWAKEQVQGRFGIETTVISHLEETDSLALDDLSGALLFRNVRELLANVVKHSRAGNVQVVLERAGDNLELTVRDDGQGCDPDTTCDSSSIERGLGLFSIGERMADLGGALEIESRPGQGFAATLVMPLGLDRSTASV